MLKPLTKCTNPVHEFRLFNTLINWQIANDIWCSTKSNTDRNTYYFALFKSESEVYEFAIYSIIIWKLNIKFGFIKQMKG